MRRAKAWGAVLSAGMLAGATPASAQEGSIWPERGENLQVLPADFSGSRIRAVMLGFSEALGVRCSYCHVGEEGAPLSTYDFAADANPNKDRARAMYRMLGDINRHLREIPPSGPGPVNMWCHTCHSGRPRPQTLDEAVMEAHESGGGNAAIERFLSLRERFLGAAAYDFRASSVDALADALLARADSAAALAILTLNTRHHPGRAEAWERLGDLRAATRDPSGAREAYLRALELEPHGGRIRAKLERLPGALPGSR